MSEKVYLRQNVVAEPLVNQWYAWPYLIAPATAAMFTSNWHLKLMQSFIASPQVHIAALKNPAMLGGPFINYSAGRVGEIKALMERTLKKCARQLELAQAIKQCDEMLRQEADGLSLESRYEKVPEVLKGYIELTYDLNSHPSCRFIESLLYHSPYYDLSAQSIGLTLVERDERAFAFSTPRLAEDNCLNLRRPFKDASFDELFKTKSTPQRLGFLKELFELEGRDAELFSSLFTEEAPAPPDKYSGPDVRVRYLGHACLLIETKSVTILCDPVIGYKDAAAGANYTYAEMPEKIDYVLITHNHADHCMFETLLQLRHKIRTVIVPKNSGGQLSDPSMKLILQNIGFADTREIDDMEAIDIEDGFIMGLPFFGEHGDLNIRSKTAYLIRLLGNSILCVADSNNIEPRLYKHVHEIVGDVELMFVGMECDGAPLSWLYGPLLTQSLARKQDHSRRLNGSDFERGMSLVQQFNPKSVYVYAMGLEPWLTYLTSIKYTEESRPIVESNMLVQECRKRGLLSERLHEQRDFFLPAR